MHFAIGQVARRAELRPSAIRYYESAGLLPRPRRRGGRRVYDDTVLQWLALIKLARSAGFTIVEIRRLLHGFDRKTPPPKRWQLLAQRKIRELRAHIERERAMLRLLERLRECECPTLDECGSVAALRFPGAAADGRL